MSDKKGVDPLMEGFKGNKSRPSDDAWRYIGNPSTPQRLPRNGKVKEVTLSMPEWLGPLREIILIFDGVPTGIGTIQLIWVNPETGERAIDIYKIQRG